jgi:hypothetical protein
MTPGGLTGMPVGPTGFPIPSFIAPPQMPGAALPGNMTPGWMVQGGMAPGATPPGAMMPGATPPGVPGAGGMFQSILGVTGQMSMQAGSVMPRVVGMATLLSGGAQIAQIIVQSRKQGCAILLASAGLQLPEAGGQGVIAVSAPLTCLWQAQSDSDWLQITSGGPAMGPGIVKYAASPASAGMLRTGVISITGIAGAKVRGNTSTTIRQGH